MMKQARTAEDLLAKFRAAKPAHACQPARALYHFNTYGPVINLAGEVPVSLKSVLDDLGYVKPQKGDA